MTLVGKILLYIDFDASLIETTLENKFDFSDKDWKLVSFAFQKN